MLAILIVEDDPILALDLEGTILDLGHRVCATADTARSAVDAAALYRPDLILMDYSLADGSNGVEAASRIRCASQVPIVFVTAHANTDCRARMESLPRTRIIAKPHSPQMIAAVIADAEAA